MNCTEFELKLTAAVESHQSLDSRELEAHLADCADCRVRWEEYALLEQAVSVWRESTPPIDIVDAVVAELAFDGNGPIETPRAAKPYSVGAEPQHEETARRNLPTGRVHPRRLFRSVMSACVVAAAVLIAVFTLPTSDSTPGNGPLPPLVENPAPDPDIPETVAGPVLDADDDLDTLLLDAGGAYLVLARDAVDVVADATLSFPSTQRENVTTQRNQSIDAPTASDWVDKFEDELAPVGRNLGQAFDFLIEAVPAEVSPAT